MSQFVNGIEYNDYPDEIHYTSGVIDGPVVKIYRPINPDPERVARNRKRINDLLNQIQDKYEARQIAEYKAAHGIE